MRRQRFWIGIAAIALTIGGLVMLLNRWSASLIIRRPLTIFTEKGVTVEIAMEEDQKGQTWLASTFTPDQPGFHLYSTELSQQGIDGVGRPTWFEVIAPPDFQPCGPLQADQPVHEIYFNVLQRSFPVYPDGAVTVRLPVEKPDRPVLLIELSVTYMACSDTTCLPPVENKHIVAILQNP